MTELTDFVFLALLIAFCVSFVALGFLFLRKKKQERVETLTKALEEDTGAVKVPPAITTKPLGAALKPTRDGFISKISQILSRNENIAEDALEELEATLFTADIGVRTADKLMAAVRDRLRRSDFKGSNGVLEALKEEMRRILRSPHKKIEVHPSNSKPKVIMFVGVNGVGKTTTIGKLAYQLTQDGNKVLLGAGDTFRAAAAEQLDIWAQRSNVPIVSGNNGADPASVLYDAVLKGKTDQKDIVLCDTAGRLHTKVNLMEELKKVYRVLGKACEGAPHEVYLVVDATTGQNAIMQAREFAQSTPLTGLILTKLDGTAKGGIVVGIVDELGIPVKYIGVGESVDDLRLFDVDDFVNALFA